MHFYHVILITWWVFYKKQELLTPRSVQFIGGVRVAHLINLLCCAIMCLCIRCLVRLYLHLYVEGFMSYIRCLYLFLLMVMLNIYCVVCLLCLLFSCVLYVASCSNVYDHWFQDIRHLTNIKITAMNVPYLIYNFISYKKRKLIILYIMKIILQEKSYANFRVVLFW